MWLKDKGQAASSIKDIMSRYMAKDSHIAYRVLLSTSGRLQSPEVLWRQDNPTLL